MLKNFSCSHHHLKCIVDNGEQGLYAALAKSIPAVTDYFLLRLRQRCCADHLIRLSQTQTGKSRTKNLGLYDGCDPTVQPNVTTGAIFY